jgi:hypothetical protein
MIDKFIVSSFSYDPEADTLSALIFLSESPNQDSPVTELNDAHFTYNIDMDFSRNTAAINAQDQFEANIAYLPTVLLAFATALEAEQEKLDHTASPADYCENLKTFTVTY